MHSRPLIFLTIAVALAAATTRGRADEITRQIQEELRRRRLYFNEIDGRATPDLTAALRKYQERQGFAPTGVGDNITLRSLGIIDEPAPPADGGGDTLPDMAVLRSDAALPDANARPAVLPPAPPPAANAVKRAVTNAEATEFVRRYLAACESPNVHDELAFYGDRVDYFDHGIVDRQYVQNELAVYDQRWPRRSYTANAVRLVKSGDKTTAKFRVSFKVANAAANRSATGRTDETFGLARRGDGGLEIVSIREERVRRSRSRHARRHGFERDPVVRSVRKVFRSIFRH